MKRGFTLIELSIVLVIIALIVGGVLVGKDMIEQARQRQLISEIEKLETTALAFKNKYNCLPGDCTTVQANTFGFTTHCGGWGADGNGVIDYYNGSPVASCNAYYGCICESMKGFAAELSSSGMINQSIYTNSSGSGSAVVVNLTYPTAAIIPVSFTAYGYGKHWLVLDSGPYHTGFALPGQDTHAKVLSSNEARSIDGKADDGKPLTGKIQALGYEGATGSGPCATNPAGGAYAGTCIGYNNMGCASGNTPTSDYALSDVKGSNQMWAGCKLAFRTSY